MKATSELSVISARYLNKQRETTTTANNKSQGKKSRFQSTRALGRKSKTKITKSQELSIERKPELDVKPTSNVDAPTQTEIIQMQQQSLSKCEQQETYRKKFRDDEFQTC